MPDGKLSITEFAAKIKAKYPSYQGVDDVTLTKKIIEKYPDYASSVDMSGSEGVKKKEPSVSQVGGTLGISAAPSGLTEVKVSGGLIPEYKGVVGEVKVDERDPIKSYKNALYTKQNTDLERLLQRERKPKVATTFVAKAAAPAKEKKAEAAKEFVQIKKEEKEKGLLPAYQIDKEVVKVKKTYEQDQNASVAHLMKATGETNPDVIFSLPKEELQRLVRQGNETDEAAVKAISEAQDVKDILGKSSNLEEAALYYGGLKDPQLQGQIDRNIVPGTNRVGNVSSLVSEGSLGRKMYDFLSDPIVQNEIKKNSALNQELKQTVPTLINKYPDFGKAYLGNKISDKMEQMGINNAILNVVTEEETDKAVDELAKEGEMTPNEVQFYKDNLKGKGGITDILRGTIGENYYSTPGALENILGGAVKGTLAIGKGASELTGLRQALLGKTEVNARDISDRDLAVNIAPKGIAHEMSMSGGQFLGQLAPIMFGAELGAAKLGLTAEGANSALFGLQTYANNIAEARRLFPDNQLKQRGFATIASSIDALLLPKIGNNKIVKSVLGEMKPEVANIVNGYATKTLSKEAATEGIENAFLKAVKKVPEAAGYFAKQTGKNTAIMTALDLAHQVNEGVFEGKPAKEWVNGERLFDNARSAAIGSVFLSALGARAEMANKGVTAKLIYQNAERPDVWEAEIKRVGEQNGESQADIQDKIDNARYASSVYQDLKGDANMTEKQKAKYLLNSLIQRAKTREAEAITDPVLKQRATAEAKKIQEDQEALLDNKDDGTIEGDVSDVIEGENLIQKKREQEAPLPAEEIKVPKDFGEVKIQENSDGTFTPYLEVSIKYPNETVVVSQAIKRETSPVNKFKTKEEAQEIGEKDLLNEWNKSKEGIPSLPAEEKITEEVKIPEEEKVVEEKGEVAPIRQLGTGANVYFENEKYRVNDSKDKVLLNVQGTGDTGVIANLEFQTPKEAVEVARELNRLYPNGVPEAVLLDKVVEDIKTGKYKEEVPVTEEIKTKREVEPKKAEVTSLLKDVESTVKALKEKRLKKGKYEILQAKLEPTDDSSKVVYQYAESDSPSDVKEFPGYFYSKTPSDRISITDSSNGYKIVEGANKKEALQKFKDLIDKKGGFESLKKQSEEIVDKRERAFAEKYHKAKKDGSSPDLVKSIEDLLGGEVKEEPSLPLTEELKTNENVWGTNKGLQDNFYTKDVNGLATKIPLGKVEKIEIDDYEFYVSKVDGDWKVIEPKSGLEISTGKLQNNKKSAIEDAEIRLKQNGGSKNLPTLIDRAINGFIERNSKLLKSELPTTEEIKTQKYAVQKPSAGEVLQRPQEGVGEAGGKRGGVEQGIKGPEVTEEGKVEGEEREEVTPPVPPTTETKVFEEELPSEMSGIAHAETEKMRTALGLPEYERVKGKSDLELDQEAQEAIQKGYNIEKLIKSVEEGNPPTGVENYILARYKGALEKEFEKTQSEEVLNKLKRLSDATDFIGTKQSEAFRTRKALVPREETLSQYFLDEMEDAGVDRLTDQQKATITEEYKAINEAKEALQKKVEELQAENAKLKAQEEINKDKKTAPKKTRKTSEDFTAERKQIITDIREKLRKARGQSQVTVLPYANELIAIAPDVAKLAKSLIEQGVLKLEDIAANIKDTLKDDIKDITEKDVIDILAGEYTRKQKTKNQLSEKLKDLRDQAKLINKLADLENGEVPKTERKKIERNREIKELRDKIREHDLTKLSEVKNRMKSQIEKIEKDLREGNFDKEPEKREIVLDKEGKELKSKFLELRKQREVRRLKTQYEQRTKKQKAIDKVVEVFNIPRSVMASTDFSAPLNQAFIATINYPKEAKAAAEQMIKSTFSQKAFDEWFYELKDDSRYDLMKELKLGISDPHSPFLTAREEAFMSGMAERVPVVGEFIKGSERAYVQYLNKLRVDLFNRFVDRFESQGKTYKNSPELYDATTKYINNITGKGDLGKLDQFAPVFNALMFSPRLMASRINLLNPYYFAKLPKELKIQYAKDMGATLALGSTLLSLFALYGMTQKDDDPKKIKVETDPRSTDFGRIRQGNTRWDIWGGFQPYVRLAAQVGYGERKSSNTGLIQSLDGEGAFGQTRGDVLSTFARGKLAPVPAMAIDLIQGRNAMGEKVELKDELLSHIIPLSSQAIAEGVKEYGPKGAVLAGLPAVFGVGVQSYSQKPKEVKGEIEWRDRKIKLNDEEKKFFQNKYNEISKINLDKLSALPEYKQADLETQAGLRSLVQKASMKKAEDILTRRYASKFRLVKREGNEEEKKIDVIKRKLRLK